MHGLCCRCWERQQHPHPDLAAYGAGWITKVGWLGSAQKFKSRYATFGFSDEANLDEGAMWPTSFALKQLTAAEEARIGALVKKAVSVPSGGAAR